MGALARHLEAERPWAETFMESMLNKADALDSFGRDRVTQNVQWTIGKQLQELREAEAQQTDPEA